MGDVLVKSCRGESSSASPTIFIKEPDGTHNNLALLPVQEHVQHRSRQQVSYLARGEAPALPRLREGCSEMNSRQFDAAHDRYLEPPDDDGEETWDEMDLADIERQARLDEGN